MCYSVDWILFSATLQKCLPSASHFFLKRAGLCPGLFVCLFISKVSYVAILTPPFPPLCQHKSQHIFCAGLEGATSGGLGKCADMCRPLRELGWVGCIGLNYLGLCPYLGLYITWGCFPKLSRFC